MDDDEGHKSPPIRSSPEPDTANSSNGNEEEEEEDHVMSEIHLGCPPNFSGSFISHFAFSLPQDAQYIGSSYECEIGSCSNQPEAHLDDDGDLVLTRRSKQSMDKFVVAIQHNITSSIPRVGLQVWRAELVLTDFVLHKMFTSSEFDGIVAVELGAGTGLVGMLLARVAKTVFLTDHGAEILENCDRNVHLNTETLALKASVYVRELDWKALWPPTLDNCPCRERYACSASEIEELESASLLVAADVIYSDDLTDALFSTLERLMSRGSKKVLYMALEKRYNFSLDDLNIVANGYSRFRSYVRDDRECKDLQNGSLPCFSGTVINLNEIPQYANNYNRGQDVELWRIKYMNEEEKSL